MKFSLKIFLALAFLFIGYISYSQAPYSCSNVLDFEFYDGTPAGNTVNNIPTTGALGKGQVANFNVANLQNTFDPGDVDSYAIRYKGYIQIATAGSYTFYTNSDDGSKLFIDGVQIVNNDGIHPAQERSGVVNLSAGYHTITILFFEASGGESLTVQYQGPGIAKQSLPFSILYSDCPVVTSSTDADGDGINNSTDLDDDNDGILDEDECGSSSGGTSYVQAASNLQFFNNPTNAQGNPGTTYANNGTTYPGGDSALLLRFPIAVPIGTVITVFLGADPAVNNSDMQIQSSNAAGANLGFLANANNTYPGSIRQVSFTVSGSALQYIRVVAYNQGARVYGASYGQAIDCTTVDTDGDGIPNSIDLDSDNDGIYDAVEAGHGIANSNGRLYGLVGTDGIPDSVQAAGQQNSGTKNYSLRDSDSDGNYDFIELDSDNDGCYDVREAGFTESGTKPGELNGSGYSATTGKVTGNTNGYSVPADNNTNGIYDYREAGSGPAISSQPSSITVNGGENATFTVTASGSGISYQWQLSTNGGSTYTNISGATSSSYTVVGASSTQNGYYYRVIVTGSSSNYVCNTGVTSNPAVLSITDQPPTIIATGNQQVCPGSNVFIAESVSITDPDDTQLDAVFIQITSNYANGSDLLTLTGSHPGITPSWDVAAGKLTLTGPATLASFESAILAVQFSTNPNLAVGNTRNFSIVLNKANYLASTDHYYEYVPNLGITWTAARDAAALRTFYGLQGYLATITTQEESDLLGSQASGAGWIGASDAAVEGDWRWVTGPEAGTLFWRGVANGTAFGYEFWNTDEPNQLGDEDYAHITAPGVGILGSWNDLTNTGAANGDYQPKGYLVEYGGMPGDPASPTISASTSITAAIPNITDTTPGERCGPGTVTLEATASSGTLNWYAAATGGSSLGTGTSFTTPSISSTTTYYVDATNNGCTTGTRTAVVATIKPIPTITGSTPGERCGPGTVTLEATASAGTLNWYAAATGGSALATGTSFVTPSLATTTTYYVDATENGCTTPTRTPVVATVNDNPTVDLGANQQICEGDSIILNAATTGGSGPYTYAWSTGQTTASITITPAGNSSMNVNQDYTVTVTDQNGCQDTDVVTVTIESAPTATVAVVDATCGLDNGEFTFTFPDHPNRTAIEFSIDNQATYGNGNLVYDNSGSLTYSGLAAATYEVWVRWGNDDCPVYLGQYIIGDDPQATVTTQPTDQTVFVNSNASFTAATANADTFQWQVSTNGGVSFSNISDGAEYSGTQTASLTLNTVEQNKNGYRYRVLVSNSTTVCTPVASNQALLTVQVRTVITNSRITYRVKKN